MVCSWHYLGLLKDDRSGFELREIKHHEKKCGCRGDWGWPEGRQEDWEGVHRAKGASVARVRPGLTGFLTLLILRCLKKSRISSLTSPW